LKTFEKTGCLSLDDIPLPSQKQLERGVVVLECVQKIPCNPCVEICPVHAISMKSIIDLPEIDFDKCTGCGSCIGVCPGLAIFLVKVKDGTAWVTVPYEFLPVPTVGDTVKALDRMGEVVGDAQVKKVKKQGKTWIITVEVPANLAMTVRNIKVNT
jgi:Fe-S-cluster-containing hydrogenase component 2